MIEKKQLLPFIHSFGPAVRKPPGWHRIHRLLCGCAMVLAVADDIRDLLVRLPSTPLSRKSGIGYQSLFSIMDLYRSKWSASTLLM